MPQRLSTLSSERELQEEEFKQLGAAFEADRRFVPVCGMKYGNHEAYDE